MSHMAAHHAHMALVDYKNRLAPAPNCPTNWPTDSHVDAVVARGAGG